MESDNSKLPTAKYLSDVDFVKDMAEVIDRQYLLHNDHGQSRFFTKTTIWKAAWILCIHCFLAKEVVEISCSYHFGTEPEAILKNTVVRVDPSCTILCLLNSIEAVNPHAETIRPSPDVEKSSEPIDGWKHIGGTLRLQHSINEDPKNGEPRSAKELVELSIVNKDSHTSFEIRIQAKGFQDVHEHMLSTFQHIVDQLRAGIESMKIGDIQYCSEKHRERIRTFTRIEHASNSRCLHDLIIQRCQLHPDKLAVRSFDGDLTYGDLDSLSLRLAHYLVQMGVKPEEYILSGFQKSTWAIVARLSILRAGAAYISIHASNPPAYLNSVINRTRSRMMISDPVFADRFRNSIETVIAITPEWLWKLPVPKHSVLCPSVDASTACTILFTSGSTGRPKAIIQEHRSYASAIRDYARNLGLDDTVRFLHFDDYAFDISNLEFLVPLLLGGCCCVPGPMRDVQDLANNIRMLSANIAFLTPTVAIKIDPEAMNNLKTLCVGGEPLPKDLLSTWAGTSTKLVNQFGMGEAAVCCAYNDDVYRPDSSPSTIGRPSSGTIWVVDPAFPDKLMPIGAIGEIVIEGPHLARGYLDQDHQAIDRTKPAGFLQYIPPWLKQLHPDRQTARLYRSGDLARWTSDGRIEYLGRKDTIIKLDGCRINILEVEHVARKCLAVSDTIVVDLLGVIDGNADPRLAAFLYLHNHPDNSETAELLLKDANQDVVASQKASEIQKVLAAHLPLYMVPTLFLLVTQIPRTPSKKTDRRMIRLLSQKYCVEERNRWSDKMFAAVDKQLLPP